MALTSHIEVRVKADQTSALDLATAALPLDLRNVLDWADGTTASKANRLFSDTRTTDSTGEDLDLAGVLTDAFGSAITFARIRAILIRAASGNAANVLLGGAASNQFDTWVGDATDVVAIRPGGIFLLVAPDATAYSVTASTGDLLHVEAASGSVTYDVVIIGASA